MYEYIADLGQNKGRRLYEPLGSSQHLCYAVVQLKSVSFKAYRCGKL